MLKHYFYLVVILVLVAGGCSLSGSNTRIDSNVAVAQSVSSVGIGRKVKTCDITQRDLTKIWAKRIYLCAPHARKENTQLTNDRQVKVIAEYKDSNAVVLPTVNQYLSTESRASRKARILEAMRIVKASKRKDNPPARKSVGDGKPEIIIFASNTRVLGPEGRAKTVNLSTRIENSASVKLRGLFLPGEIKVEKEIYKEILSVARALAVRKAWADMGIDISNIKILHHNPKLSGRSVQVFFGA